ncbi:Hypothetical protein NTJ_10850 [Nesidiocoris tenuis]|uniref:Gustatory receptor n=1 Tax=Nesidiocoris tenuis TaxID=355587 RepID=A0ABN7B0V4_9HEMI|nr:Hypothetical protein NTJ_10850 [Nesidiocoris tenuis]
MYSGANVYNLWFNLSRMIGAYPYSKDSEGRLTIRVCSVPLVYTLCLRVGFLYILVDYYIYAVSRLSTENQEYLDFIISVSNLAFFIPHALVMPSACRQWPSKAAFAKAWAEYQNQYTKITGETYTTHFKKRTIDAFAIGLPITFPLAYFATSRLMKTNGFHHTVLVCIASLDALMATATWNLIMSEMADITDNIGAEIRKVGIENEQLLPNIGL